MAGRGILPRFPRPTDDIIPLFAPPFLGPILPDRCLYCGCNKAKRYQRHLCNRCYETPGIRQTAPKSWAGTRFTHRLDWIIWEVECALVELAAIPLPNPRALVTATVAG